MRRSITRRITITRISNPEIDHPMSSEELKTLYRRMFNEINNVSFAGKLEPIQIEHATPDMAEHDSSTRACFCYDTDSKEEPIIYLGFKSMRDDGVIFGVSVGDIQDLYHEMIHYYCYLHDISDVNPAGHYHNKHFKEEAEKHGGICSYTDAQVGYSDAVLPEKTAWTILNAI